VSVPHVADCAYPPREGNRVAALIDGGPTFRRICDAIAAAAHSVFVAITFATPDYPMPDGRGTLMDVLDRAASRGIDVRVLIWRPADEARGFGQNFEGSDSDHALLRARESQSRIRWDQAGAAFSHHQKIWLVDAGQEGEVGFVGGINPTSRGIAERGHRTGGQHDAYIEIAGPAATDIHHGFVQRWNEASERFVDGGTWGEDGDLPFPTRLSAPRGGTRVQIQRTVLEGLYRDGRASPGAEARDIAAGERSILAQYLQAIAAARRTIYIENQAFEVPEILTALDAALTRGVAVIALVPGEAEERVVKARARAERPPFFDMLAGLGRHPLFTLAGIAAPDGDLCETEVSNVSISRVIPPPGATPLRGAPGGGITRGVRREEQRRPFAEVSDGSGGRRTIYVHDKLMLVDGEWATIGSANLHRGSLFWQTEMNAAIWDKGFTHALRCDLFGEHLGRDTDDLDDVAALTLFAEIARRNLARREAGDMAWDGMAYALDPAAYGA